MLLYKFVYLFTYLYSIDTIKAAGGKLSFTEPPAQCVSINMIESVQYGQHAQTTVDLQTQQFMTIKYQTVYKQWQKQHTEKMSVHGKMKS